MEKIPDGIVKMKDVVKTMDDDTLLGLAIRFSVSRHHGQHNRFNNEPYILHPMRIMLSVKTRKEQIVAILHDLIEDTPTTREEIEELFGKEIADAVVLLSRPKKKHDYMEYVRNLAPNPLARVVKLADLADNSDRSRFQGTPAEKDEERWRKYAEATKILVSESWMRGGFPSIVPCDEQAGCSIKDLPCGCEQCSVCLVMYFRNSSCKKFHVT